MIFIGLVVCCQLYCKIQYSRNDNNIVEDQCNTSKTRIESKTSAVSTILVDFVIAWSLGCLGVVLAQKDNI